MPDHVRVRFAPSPTGYLHIGGARTALFNYLFARHQQGTFILRIEDTDRTRYQEGALQEIFDGLRWLGLAWDEGPEVGGQSGPYFQSERLAHYRAHADDLIAKGAAYRCFCNSERLDAVRKEQEKAKVTTKYDRRCRGLPAEEVARLVGAGAPHVVRLAIPDGRTVTFNDLIRGAISYQSEVLDDLVLMKTDGFPTYHLANVVDDHLMRITHVLRGDEWIASTPRHILMYEAFGWAPPIFAHMPVILSPDGGKLSKRKGAASVSDYRRAGHLPHALLNFIALLGWAPGDDREVMSLQELIDAFGLEKVNPKPAVLDEVKLEWMNQQYFMKEPPETIVPLLEEHLRMLKVACGASGYDLNKKLREIVVMLSKRTKTLVEMAQSSKYFFGDAVEFDPKAKSKFLTPERAPLLKEICHLTGSIDTFTRENIEQKYLAYATEHGLKLGEVAQPVRTALTGSSASPGLFEVIEVMGRDRVVLRLQKAIETVEEKKEPEIALAEEY